MTDQERKAMEMALEALEMHVLGFDGVRKMELAIEALESALAKPDETETLKRCLFQMQEAAKALAQDHGFDRTASHMAGEYVDTNWDTSDMAHRAGGLSMDQENEACGYAKRLAQAIWEKYYKEESPDWKPKNDVLGVLTQIDNMTCGLEKSQPEQEPVCTKIEGNQFETFKVRYEDAVKLKDLPVGTKLYTAPPSKPWVSLTDEEIGLLSTNNTFSGMHPDYLRECVCAIEAKLKEKNHGN